MAPTLSPPSFLASFNTVASASSAPAVASGSRSPVKVASVQTAKGKGRRAVGEEAAIAVDGEGVWRFDISTTNPSSSHTVPASTTFATAPLCLASGESRLTLVGVTSGDEIPKEKQGKIIWVWRDEETVKEEIELEDPVTSLLALPSHPGYAVVLSASSPLLLSLASSPPTLLPSDLHSLRPSSARVPVLAVAFSCKQATFAPGEQGDVIVEFLSDGTLKAWSVVSNENDVPVLVLERDIKIAGLEPSEVVTRAGISHKGLIQVLTNRSHLHTNTLSATTISAALPTHTFPSPSSLTTISPLPSTPYSLLLEPSTSLLHLLSPTYPAVLASTELPSSMLGAGSAIDALPLGGGRIALVGAAHASESGTAKIGVWVVDVLGLAATGGAAPGSIAEALFTGDRTAKVLIPAPAHVARHSSSAEPFHNLVARMRLVLSPSSTHTPEEQLVQAEKIWTEEFTLEQERLKATHRKPDPSLPSTVARSLLSLLLEPTLSPEAYPREIIGRLILRSMITDRSHASSHGGFVATLLARGDWDNVMAALRTKIPEIPEPVVVAILKRILAFPENANREGAPTATRAITEVVRYGVYSEDSAWKDALKNLGIEAVVKILEVIDGWFAKWNEGTQAKLPEPEETIPLLTLIFDTHLLPLLTHPSAPPVLASLHAHLAPYVRMQRELESAKSVLDGCLRMGRATAREQAAAQAAAAASAAAAANSANSKTKKAGGGKRTPASTKAADAKVYRVEEFAL